MNGRIRRNAQVLIILMDVKAPPPWTPDLIIVVYSKVFCEKIQFPTYDTDQIAVCPQEELHPLSQIIL